MLESRAAEAKPIISLVALDLTQEDVLENPAELDITEVFKLESGNDTDESPITHAVGNFKAGRRKKVKSETSTKQDKSKEPGEISAWSSGESNSEEKEVIANSFDIATETSQSGLGENENSKERVLSVIEQDQKRSEFSNLKSVPHVSLWQRESRH